MARATFVKKAQKDIYQQGKVVQYESKVGKRAGQILSKLDRTIPSDESDKVWIAKGTPYYWWAFMHGGTHYSKSAPKGSQLTQSNYLSQYLAIQEEIAEWSPLDADDVICGVDDFKGGLETVRD